LHDHQLLSPESVVAHSPPLLVVVGHVNFPAIQLRCRLRSEYRTDMVPSTEGLLLCNSGPWLRDNCFADYRADSPTHSISHTAPHSATYATNHATRTHHYPPAAHSETWTC